MTAATIRPSIRLPGNLAPLGYRNYALYWFGLACSNGGRWVEQTGAVWLVYELTNSPLLLGVLGLVKAVPTLFVAPIAGVVADRVDQRKLLFVTQGLSLLFSLVLGLLVVTGLVQVWHVYLEILCTSIINAFDVSARQSLFPRLIPRSVLPQGVTLTSLASRTSALVGPAVGGIAIAVQGEASPFFINAATFLVLMGALLLMRNVPPQEMASGESFATELREGLSYITGTKVLSGLLRLEIVFGFFQINPVIIAIIGREILGVGPEGLGGLLAAPALGAVGGLACLLIFGQSRRPGRFVVYLQWIYSALLIFFALSTNYVLSFVLLAGTGFLDVMETVTRLSITQLAAPARMRGRITSNMRTVTGGIGPMAQTVSGALADIIGGPAAIVVSSIALVTSALTSARFNRPLWDFSVENTMDDPEVIAAGDSIAVDLSGTASPSPPPVPPSAAEGR